jgi:hypothetical protein
MTDYSPLGLPGHALSAYSEIGGQEQTRFRSPYADSIRPTVGQNFRWRTHGNGNAARSRE